MKITPKYLHKLNELLLYPSIFFLALYMIVSGNGKKTKQVILPEDTGGVTFSFQKQEQPSVSPGHPFITLDKTPIQLLLPDLRNSISYHGANQRPDIEKERKSLHFSIRGTPHHVFTTAGEKTYLVYDRNTPGRFSFSSNNAKTGLWFVPQAVEYQAEIAIYMDGCDGQLVTTPQEFHHFFTVESPISNQRIITGWKIGGEQVDTALLYRQKACWHGQDLFLKEYGGNEFLYAQEKERIIFTAEDGEYSCYVGPLDCLVFIDEKWHQVEPGLRSQGNPLLQVKKIDSLAIHFDLWDGEGKNRLLLTLQKTPSPTLNQDLLKIKVVGAKSKKKWIAEICETRTSINEDDWLLLSENTCERLSTIEQIENYIQGRMSGTLLVLEGTKRINNMPSLVGKLFNEKRNEYIPVAIPLLKSSMQEAQKPSAHNMQDDDDEESDIEEASSVKNDIDNSYD